MMLADIIFYNTKRIQPKIKTKLLERLFGKLQKSNYAKYKYQVDGIIPLGSYIRPVRAVLIIKKECTMDIIALFNQYGIQFKRYEILIEDCEFKKIQIFSR